MKAWSAAKVGTLMLAVVATGMFTGCATTPPKPIPVTLDYRSDVGQPTAANFSGQRISIAPLDDARQNKLLVGNIAMREEDDAGTWVANAIRLELEKAGAQVDALNHGSRPATGIFISGRVNDLQAVQTGWSPGGLVFGVVFRSGYTLKYNMTIEVVKEGIPVQTKQYNVAKHLDNSLLRSIGGAAPVSDIPPHFQDGLRELIRSQILPDISTAIGSQK
jgi:hypothetical protein